MHTCSTPRFVLSILVLINLSPSTLTSASETIELLLPYINPQQIESSQKEIKNYIKRIGRVQLTAAQLLPPRAAENTTVKAKRLVPGTTLTLSFFPESIYTVTVDFEDHSHPNIFSINGRVAGAELSTFSMTVTEESYIISLQDISRGTLYRVVGEKNSDFGRVTEYDVTQMPAKLYSPPIVPPTEQVR